MHAAALNVQPNSYLRGESTLIKRVWVCVWGASFTLSPSVPLFSLSLSLSVCETSEPQQRAHCSTTRPAHCWVISKCSSWPAILILLWHQCEVLTPTEEPSLLSLLSLTSLQSRSVQPIMTTHTLHLYKRSLRPLPSPPHHTLTLSFVDPNI